MYGARARTIAERIELFVRRATELEAHPALAQPTSIGFTLQVGAGPATATVTEPDDTALSSLLLKLRPFLLQDEDAYLPEILNLARRLVDDPELVHAIESGRHGYEQASVGSMFKVAIGGREMTPKAAAELYLYSTYYHSHRDLEEQLNAITGPAASMTRYLLIDYIAEVTKVITWTHSVIAQARSRGLLRAERLPEYPAHPHLPQPPLRSDPRTLPQPITLVDERSREAYERALSCWRPPADGDTR